MHVSPGWENQLLSTTQTSCNGASEEEQQHFFTSTAASDADSFDIHLAVGNHRPLYVFLDPTRRRFTGCPKAADATAAGSSAAAGPTCHQATTAVPPARE
jgi:hypothetical protein